RLHLVAVGNEVFALRRIGPHWHQGPFHAGRESAAAAATQVGGLHQAGDLCRGHFLQRTSQGLVATGLLIALEVQRRLAGTDVPRQRTLVVGCAHLYCSRMLSTLLLSSRSRCRSSPTSIAGARSQVPRQGIGSSVKRPSAVVWPMPTPSFCCRR